MSGRARIPLHGYNHRPGGSDPIPGIVTVPAGTDFEDVILASNPDGLWKLDETSGTTAFDSSGNGRHLVVGSDTAPTWAQAAGPPGTVTAGFSSMAQRLHYSSYPTLSGGDFTVVGWAYYTDDDPADVYLLMGQGTAGSLGGSGMDGWMLAIVGSSGVDPKKAKLYIGDGVGFPDVSVVSNNPLVEATWYQLAFTRTSGVFRMYVNGLLQAATSSAAITPGTGDLVFGSSTGSNPTFHLDGRGSWWAVYGRALPGSELLDQYELGTTGPTDTSGQVPISDGAGGSSWGYVDTPSLADEAVTPAKIEPGDDGDTLQTVSGAVVWAPAAGSTFDPATATTWWFPLVDSDGTLVLDGDGNLIPTLIPI